MNIGLSKPLGMVLLAAAVFAAAGCAAPASPTPASSSASALSPSASTSASPAADPTETSSAGPSAAADAAGESAGPPGPTTGEVAAPKPSFAPPEQKYLESRVPQGTDPNAVLQVGQEHCAQLETVKAADQKAAVSHLVEKLGTEVVDAIADLCPGLQPELDAAGRGFTDGEFSIGAAAPKEGSGSIAPGKYEAWNPSPKCTLAAYDAAGGTLAESNGTSAITIPAGAVRVVSHGCYTWLAA